MSKTWLKIIAFLEIAGGICGILIIIGCFFVYPFNIYTLLIAPIAIAIYAFSTLAGYWLWKGHRFGRRASIVIQAIQLPKIFSPFIIFMFSFGFDFWLQFLVFDGISNFGFEFRFLAFNQLFFSVADAPTGIGVSLTAIVFLMMLIKHRPEIIAEETGILPPPPPSFEQNSNATNAPGDL